MKKIYIQPEMETIYFKTEDVIATSVNPDTGFEEGGDEEDP